MSNLSQGNFTRSLRELNGYKVHDLVEWSFRPGMKFGDFAQWWREGSSRARPHEGVDLLFFLDGRGARHSLPPGTLVPPLLDGIEVARCPDFLGQTVILTHDHWDEAGRRLHSFYAHLKSGALAAGAIRLAGHPLGEIAAPLGPAPPCPPHLHLSLAWLGASYEIQGFSWPGFTAGAAFRPADPLALV